MSQTCLPDVVEQGGPADGSTPAGQRRMEVKVHCRCGQPYRFTVEPEDNRMPMPVYCPVCGAEGTVEANTFIQFAAVLWPTTPESTARLALAAR